MEEQDDDVIRSKMSDNSISEDSEDFNLELLKRMLQREKVVRLPMGIKDINWKAPNASGLQHSAAIFETVANSGPHNSFVINATQSHFREWQEDNGVAAAAGTTKRERVVDGKTMVVHVSQHQTKEDVRVQPNRMLQPFSSEPVERRVQQESDVPSEANGTEINTNLTDPISESISLKDPIDAANSLLITANPNGLLKMDCGRRLAAAYGEESTEVEQPPKPKLETVPHRPIMSRRSGLSSYPTLRVVGVDGRSEKGKR